MGKVFLWVVLEWCSTWCETTALLMISLKQEGLWSYREAFDQTFDHIPNHTATIMAQTGRQKGRERWDWERQGFRLDGAISKHPMNRNQKSYHSAYGSLHFHKLLFWIFENPAMQTEHQIITTGLSLITLHMVQDVYCNYMADIFFFCLWTSPRKVALRGEKETHQRWLHTASRQAKMPERILPFGDTGCTAGRPFVSDFCWMLDLKHLG